MKTILFIALLICMIGCASNNAARKVTIRNPNLLIISDMATDNYLPVQGAVVDAGGNVPVNGLPVPIDVNYQSGGIMSANEIEIVSATGGTVIIERGVSGNSGVQVDQLLEKIFKPTEHPFGNITVQDGDAMREHVIDEQKGGDLFERF